MWCEFRHLNHTWISKCGNITLGVKLNHTHCSSEAFLWRLSCFFLSHLYSLSISPLPNNQSRQIAPIILTSTQVCCLSYSIHIPSHSDRRILNFFIIKWTYIKNTVCQRCGGIPSLQCGPAVFSAVCPDFPLSEACGVGWVLATWKFHLKLKDPERTEIPIVKWRIQLYHKVRISSIHVLCGCLTLTVLWSNPVHFRGCSVLGLWFSDFYSRLSLGMLTGDEKILLKQREAVQIWRKSCIYKYFSALFCSSFPPAELVDHYFSYKSLYHEKFMTSQQSAHNCVPCRTGKQYTAYRHFGAW